MKPPDRPDPALLPLTEIDPALTVGAVSRLDEDDEEFDRIFPPQIRDLSGIHWTPVRVARRAAELLELTASSRVLDVGSGVGKFCLVAARHCPASFVGMERRQNLLEIAEAARATLASERVAFVHADALQAEWKDFHALYFYNPFGEHFLDEEERIDDLRFGMGEYRRTVQLTEQRLAQMPSGTKVALYHGMGGEMPPTYRLTRQEWCGTGTIEVWLKSDSG